MEKIRVKNITLNASCKDKQDVFKNLSELASEYCGGENIVGLFEEREEQISTGLNDGFAIPHAKGKQIIYPGIFYLKLKTPIFWETFDNSKVEHIISFVIPENDSTYLEDLAILAQNLQNKEFINSLINCKTKNDVYTLFNKIIISGSEENKKTKLNLNSKHFIAGIAACPAGLAHTYMAKKALEDELISRNIGCKVEAHGSLGIEDKLSSDELKKVEFLIVTADVAVETSKFKNKFIYKCSTNEMIKDSKKMVDLALKAYNEYNKGAKLKENLDPFDITIKDYKEIKSQNKFVRWMIYQGRGVLKHAMTGIGYCIPLLIACGLLVGISQLLAQFTVEGGGVKLGGLYSFSWDNNDWVKNVSSWNGFLYTMNILGMNIGLGMLFLITFGGFVGYSVNGKAGLASGMFCGVICILRQTGFIGVIIVTLVEQYLLLFVIKYMTPKGRAKVLGSVLIVPLVGGFLSISLGWWVFGIPLNKLNVGLQNMVLNVSKNKSQSVGLAALIAAMIAFDLGGPVNKAAWAAYTVIWSDTSLPDAARFTPNGAGNIAIGVPVLGVGLSTLFGYRYFTKDDKVQGTPCLFMGILGISEGAIPFLLRRPLRYLIINISGAIIGACTYVAIGGYLSAGAGIIYGWAFASKPLWYVASFLLGVIWIIIVNILWQKIEWHINNHVKFTLYFCKEEFANIFIRFSNMFTKDKRLLLETKFQKVENSLL
ncbi:PTS sugar transporter subunit IIA [Spiroplasma endosymbiont of Aspidapion aeneum]|uniref:PTS sugar transporter subunit IIA n=1 Tax=Spiroplasma endosymbiont of Aspidapion aeneum TaxID=3066276 RepID=UPI00313E3BB0